MVLLEVGLGEGGGSILRCTGFLSCFSLVFFVLTGGKAGRCYFSGFGFGLRFVLHHIYRTSFFLYHDIRCL